MYCLIHIHVCIDLCIFRVAAYLLALLSVLFRFLAMHRVANIFFCFPVWPSPPPPSLPSVTLCIYLCMVCGRIPALHLCPFIFQSLPMHRITHTCASRLLIFVFYSPAPATPGVRQAKRMEKMTVHPIFGAAYDKQEEQRDAMLVSMKTFRPPTVCRCSLGVLGLFLVF